MLLLTLTNGMHFYDIFTGLFCVFNRISICYASDIVTATEKPQWLSPVCGDSEEVNHQTHWNKMFYNAYIEYTEYSSHFPGFGGF